VAVERGAENKLFDSIANWISHRNLFPQNLRLWRSIGPGLRHFDSLELWVTVAAGDSTAF
jgi:hypothetical protein